MNIIDLIPFDHYVTRDELASATGLKDRAVRSAIQKLRKESPETVIISSSEHKGYKRPSSYSEIEACLNESRKKVREEFAKQRQLMILLKNKEQKGLGIVL